MRYCLAILCLVVSGCVTTNPSNTIDATGADMAEAIGRISERIDGLTDGLTESLERSRSLEEQFGYIDAFVQGVIAENRELRRIIDGYRAGTGESGGKEQGLDSGAGGSDSVSCYNTAGGGNTLGEGR